MFVEILIDLGTIYLTTLLQYSASIEYLLARRTFAFIYISLSHVTLININDGFQENRYFCLFMLKLEISLEEEEVIMIAFPGIQPYAIITPNLS